LLAGRVAVDRSDDFEIAVVPDFDQSDVIQGKNSQDTTQGSLRERGISAT
jgi:hypothetical protein